MGNMPLGMLSISEAGKGPERQERLEATAFGGGYSSPFTNDQPFGASSWYHSVMKIVKSVL